MDDTIVSISTSLGVGAIAIIRLSGPKAIEIVNKIFKGKDLTKVDSHTINYGYIKENDTIIDEVLVSIMRAPKTYTTEDVVEINTHGGIATTNKVLELCLTNGARLAEPGEFTKRAFLNGRIDLTQAEAVEDIITSTTDKSLNLSMNQLTGSLKKLITDTRKTMVNLMANIEVNIDYPEYEDAENITIPLLKEKLVPIKNKLSKLLEESKNAKIIKDGIDIALIGRPNVGKSSLLNLFLEEEKAIVTNIAGTTRDIVEGQTIINGIKINFIDTAGIRNTTDVVEKIGVEKSKQMISKADLNILILNNNEPLTNEDKELLELIKTKPSIIFINKNDLETKLDLEQMPNVVQGNTLSLEGIKDLKQKIIEYFNLEKIEVKDATYLTNARQNALIKNTISYIDQALEDIETEVPVDMIEINIRAAWDTLGEIIGATYKDELLDELFSNFCLGK
ncbi:MAG TPA: tRNA uridine-5-carboxymethylaminomethyl(34) synthesis GTPase MnmE [Firmicutes bacterium]|nr:tRNA uridine-5-carboxymethylaminomethyl(34) synthesis GTPase MnmE [Bacillota bacterium]